MFYLMPPAGTPIQIRDIIGIINARIQAEDHQEIFAEKIKSLSQTKHCRFFNSGRTALVYILKALSGMADPEKVEVVIPAYTCFSVAAAIAQSKLIIKLVDIDPLSMDYHYEKLYNINYKKVLAIIGCNLFGILSNWDKLRLFSREKGIFLIDDAAQSMGSKYNDRPSGSLGDAGFYSFGRGKNLSTYSGGALVTDNDKISSYIDGNFRSLDKTSLISEVSMLLKTVLYSIFIRPTLYWLPAMIPYLGLGETVFDREFSMGQLTKIQMCTGAFLLDNLSDINASRVENSKLLTKEIIRAGHYHIPGYDNDHSSVYLRLPILCRDKNSRDRLIASLKKLEIVASKMYPSTIRKIPEIEKYLASAENDFPGAQTVVDRLLSLPTHSLLKRSVLSKIILCLGKG